MVDLGLAQTSSRRSAVARFASGLSAALVLAAAPIAAQAPIEPASAEACAAIVTDSERSACYDRVFGRGRAPGEVAPEAAASVAGRVEAGGGDVVAHSLLDSRWELSPASKLGSFGIRAYQPVYVLPWVGAGEVNQAPDSPAPGRTVDTPEGLGRSEVKFQISWKTKAWQGVFGDVGDLWIGYTQSSRWQLYNAERSRPFRESNYEPEVLLAFGTDYRLFGWDGRLLTVGLNHQSNGRDQPRSRAWNRIVASVGLEREGWTLTVRPWQRIPESDQEDDNPDIEDYLGRADALLVRHVRNHEFAVMVRHSLRGGERSHGAAQIDWAFPLRGNLRGHVQIFHGYGESLIDYNFSTTRVGVGFSLIEWY